MGLKREVKFALAAWAFAPVNGEEATVDRKQLMKMAGMSIKDGTFQLTLAACQKHGLLPERLVIE